MCQWPAFPFCLSPWCRTRSLALDSTSSARRRKLAGQSQRASSTTLLRTGRYRQYGQLGLPSVGKEPFQELRAECGDDLTGGGLKAFLVEREKVTQVVLGQQVENAAKATDCTAVPEQPLTILQAFNKAECHI